MPSNIIRKINKILSYFYRNYAAPRIYSLRDRKMLSGNLELKNKYAGRRCFAVGAGPSIANIDLSKLKHEYTFVVNEFEKNPQHKALSPKFHLIMESNYFTEEGPEFWLNSFKEKDQNIPPETIVITKIEAKPFVEKYNLFKRHTVYYIGTQGIFTDKFPFNIDFNRYVPNPKNSILMCIIAAAWMGFDEIYLLGCEHSFLAQPLGPSKSLGFSHSYKDETFKLDRVDKEVLKKYITPKEMSANYESLMLNTLQLFRNYRLFYAKARKAHPNLKIFNATPNSFLDVFPMINFNDIKGL